VYIPGPAVGFGFSVTVAAGEAVAAADSVGIGDAVTAPVAEPLAFAPFPGASAVEPHAIASTTASAVNRVIDRG
jgi:hypothetical protein